MYKISGIVIDGDKNGRKLWFPTANIVLETEHIENATFCVNIEIDNMLYRWVWVYLLFKKIFEVNIFDFSKNIYGENISIYIKSKIRDNRKFESHEELSQQISQDVEYARNKEHTVLTSGSFDVIHPGHSYYLSEAQKYGEILITIVATDENIERIKWHITYHKLSQRISDIQALHISDAVIAGSNTDPLRWLQEYKPDSICLWYDQRGPFVEKIEKELSYLWLQTQIIRISPHKPEIYKSSLLKAKK